MCVVGVETRGRTLSRSLASQNPASTGLNVRRRGTTSNARMSFVYGGVLVRTGAAASSHLCAAHQLVGLGRIRGRSDSNECRVRHLDRSDTDGGHVLEHLRTGRQRGAPRTRSYSCTPALLGAGRSASACLRAGYLRRTSGGVRCRNELVVRGSGSGASAPPPELPSEAKWGYNEPPLSRAQTPTEPLERRHAARPRAGRILKQRTHAQRNDAPARTRRCRGGQTRLGRRQRPENRMLSVQAQSAAE